MEPIVYDNDILRKHFLYSHCCNTLQDVSNRDYPNRYSFTPQIECLDIDPYEKMIHSSHPNKTMDAVIGICSCRNGKQKISPRLLLIELRMDYKNIRNLSVSGINEKVDYTKTLLGAEIPLEKIHFFIYDKSISEQAKRWFKSKANEGIIPQHYVAWSVDDFGANVVSIDNLPYIPKNDINQILKDGQSAIDAKAWGKLFSFMHHWLDKAKGYKYSNSFEYECLICTLFTIWEQFKELSVSLSEDEEFYVLIIEEELSFIK